MKKISHTFRISSEILGSTKSIKMRVGNDLIAIKTDENAVISVIKNSLDGGPN